LKNAGHTAILASMSSDVQEIEQAIRSLPRPEVEQLQEWIENFLEDQLELTDEFKASIDRGKRDIAEGNLGIREGDQQ
jgi:hypothetical protein